MPSEPTKAKEQIDPDFEKQYLRYGGFCPDCGNAVEPVLNNDYIKLGECNCEIARTLRNR